MNYGVGSVFYGEGEPDIAEVSPNGLYIRYHEIVEEKGEKVCYKGFDEDYGRDVSWNKIRVDDSFKAEQLLQDLNQFMKPLKHKNIIEYYSSWVDHDTGHVNLITEAFTSGSLRKFRNKHKRVDTYAIKKWARQILEGLCFFHTHDPPMVHGNITCENIFINGNTGEVKIGDLPMFELFKEFNEDFDVFSFGICMLELATSQNLSSDFKNLRDTYRKKIDTGYTSAMLEKVKDAQFKRFIEKCLDSGSVATKLLQDPFLQTDTNSLVLELKRIIGESGFRLRGERMQKGSVLFKLVVDSLKGQKLEVEFEFNPATETTLEVAREMIEAFDLSSRDVILVAELMDNLIVRVVPFWKPLMLDLCAVM